MNLKNVKYINDLRRLNLPLHKVLIVGSGTLALLGIKGNDDLDLWVSEDLFRRLKNHRQLRPVMKHGRLFYETKDGSIEMSNTFPCTKGRIEEYLKRAIVIYGVHFKSVDDLIAWKKCMNRPKDRQHIRMIEKYKKNNVVENYLNILNMLR